MNEPAMNTTEQRFKMTGVSRIDQDLLGISPQSDTVATIPLFCESENLLYTSSCAFDAGVSRKRGVASVSELVVVIARFS
jgi:hypothetical protein